MGKGDVWGRAAHATDAMDGDDAHADAVVFEQLGEALELHLQQPVKLNSWHCRVLQREGLDEERGGVTADVRVGHLWE